MVPSTAMKAISPAIIYPDSDGKPMANNTEQLRWITILFGNLCALFRQVADVFVAADLLWYPVEGHPEICNAPDVLVAFGRPKGKRGSYQQWKEGGVPLTVAFEIVSPGNSGEEMVEKLIFYEDYGVEEYYLYNPEVNRLHVYLRRGELLTRQRHTGVFVSPRLNIRFDLTGPEMTVCYPDGRPFLSFEEVEAERARAEQRADKAEERADNVERQSRRLATLARAARQGQATAEELAELEQLERDLGL